MQTFVYVIKDEAGLHARPAGELVKAARGFGSRVVFSYGGKTAEATRLLSLMGLCARKGAALTVTVEGEDEVACAASVRAFLEQNL